MFLDRISKNTYQISWKSVQWEPKHGGRTNGQTNMTKLIVHCYDFHVNAPEMKLVYIYEIMQSEDVIRCILEYDMSKLIFGHTIGANFSTYCSTHVGLAV